MELKASLYNSLRAIWHGHSNLLSIKMYVHLPKNWKLVFHTGQSWDPCCFLHIYMNDIHTVSDKLNFILYADDTTLTSPLCSFTHGAQIMSVIFHCRLIRNYWQFRIGYRSTNCLLMLKRLNSWFLTTIVEWLQMKIFLSWWLTINEFMNWS